MTDPISIGSILTESWPQCQHEQTVVRYRMFSNNTKHLAVQCLVCGSRVGRNWLPQEGVDLSQVQPWDDQLEQQWAKQSQTDALSRRRQERIQRHTEYERYLSESDNWWATREKVMRRDNRWCQACLDADATQVHHRTYEHIFDELMWELVAVCRPCHERLHGIEEADRLYAPENLR